MPTPSTVRENKMDDFIELLYGVVIGLGSLGSLWQSSTREPFSYFIMAFVLCTLVIGAHDWFDFFENRHFRRSNKFIAYVPPIISLYFLGQMVYAATNGDMPKWFIAGIGYTTGNILNNFNYVGSIPIWKKSAKYLLHLAICVIALRYLFANNIIGPELPENGKMWLEATILTGTMIPVIILWFIPFGKYKK